MAISARLQMVIWAQVIVLVVWPIGDGPLGTMGLPIQVTTLPPMFSFLAMKEQCLVPLMRTQKYS